MKCKLMAQAHLFYINTKALQADLLDESLMAIVDDDIEIFIKILQWLPFATKVHVATQT